jgi:tetratricopeptide (TPR) repeat protein
MKLSKYPPIALAVIAAIAFVCATSLAQDDVDTPESTQIELDEWESDRLTEARLLIYEGRYSEGVGIVEEILAEHPGDRGALYLLATAYEWQGELEDAERIYRTIVSVDEEDAEAWCQIAKLQAWRGEYDEAIAFYGRLISRFGDRSCLLVGLARTLSWANRLDEALRYYERVILQEPNNVEALAGRAQVLRWKGDVRAARTVIRSAQSIDPKHPEVEREARQIKLALSPRVTVSYAESLEKDYLRSLGTDSYNLGNRTWRAQADFFLEQIEQLSFGFWSSRDWEVDKTLDRENFRLASLGFAAAASVPVSHSVSLGGAFIVRNYEKYRENVLYPLMSDEVRTQDYELWISAEYGAWDFGTWVGTSPFFDKQEREFPPLKKIEIGEQTVGRLEIGRKLWKTRVSLGSEFCSYSDDNRRTRVYGSIEGSPAGADWMQLSYAAHYQVFDSTSRNYFTPMDAFNQQASVTVKRGWPRSFVSGGLALGHLHSSNYDDIFSVGVSGTVSKNITERWRIFATGFSSYADNKYSVGWFRLGCELIL